MDTAAMLRGDSDVVLPGGWGADKGSVGFMMRLGYEVRGLAWTNVACRGISRTGSLPVFFPSGAFSQVIRDPSGSQPADRLKVDSPL
jgi:hypothetical protein